MNKKSLAVLLTTLCGAWNVSPAAMLAGFDSAPAAAGSLLGGTRRADIGPVPGVGRPVVLAPGCQPGRIYHGGPCDPNGQGAPLPGPGYQAPPSGAYPPAGDLAGYCPDPDHSEFLQAKAFAYSSNGLDYDEGGSIRWAMGYLSTHRCGTIPEYRERFARLYQLAYSSAYMDLDSAGARAFALGYVEFTPVGTIASWQAQFPAVRDLFYSSTYLDLDSGQSGRRAYQWVTRNCGDVGPIKQAFQREYQFAYSSSGLDMDDAGAKRYAANRISAMTRCGDLLRL